MNFGKMLQAYMPLPAFYALYLLGAPHPVWKRVVHLAAATVVLLAVSLSWAVAVDLTPAENRPYVGSSEDNSVMELILGHNGLRRLIPMGRSGSRGNSGPPVLPPGAGQQRQVPANPPAPPTGGQRPSPLPQRQPPQPPGGGNRPGGNPPGANASRNPRSQEVGEPGVLHLFTEPLVTEASWLLPLALLGLPLILVVLGWQWPFGRLRTPPLSEKHLALMLWGGWLLPEVIYFSFTSGLFHAYYLIMLGPPLAALVGMTAWALWRVLRQQRWLGAVLVVLLTGATIVFQIVTVQGYPAYVGGITVLSVALWSAGVGLLALRPQPWLGRAALTFLFVSLMVAPLIWSGLTTVNTNPNVALPSAGPNTRASSGPKASDMLPSPAEQTLLDYLLTNTDPDSYLVATSNANEASPFILATQRPVLTFGGFSGGDNVVDVDRLAQMVADGELRFVLGGQRLAQGKRDIAAWLADNCAIVTIPSATQSELVSNQPSRPGGQGEATVLYDCDT